MDSITELLRDVRNGNCRITGVFGTGLNDNGHLIYLISDNMHIVYRNGSRTIWMQEIDGEGPLYILDDNGDTSFITSDEYRRYVYYTLDYSDKRPKTSAEIKKKEQAKQKRKRARKRKRKLKNG